MSEQDHYEEAQQRIAEAKASGATDLDLSHLSRLTDLPPEISALTALQSLELHFTQIKDITPLQSLYTLRSLGLVGAPVKDISPLRDLSGLQSLNLSATQVVDLRPIAFLAFDEAEGQFSYGLHFAVTPAANATPELAQLSEMKDDRDRTQKTLAYLRSLPPWPEPWDPDRKPENSNSVADNGPDTDKLASEIKRLQADLQNARLELETSEQAIKELDQTEQRLKEAFEAAKIRQESFEKTSQAAMERVKNDFEDRMAAAIAVFEENNATAAPVALWEEKQAEHKASETLAQVRFIRGLIVVIAVTVILLLSMNLMPEFFAQLLAPVTCDIKNPTAETCKGFSLKGMIAVASTLTVLTVILWFTRLQMKLYLAERHLGLDARERRAFAQTYVGMLKLGDTSEEAQQQRALVYTALFRPSSDGTVKEEGGLDPAITAAISKILSK